MNDLSDMCNKLQLMFGELGLIEVTISEEAFESVVNYINENSESLKRIGTSDKKEYVVHETEDQIDFYSGLGLLRINKRK